MAGFWESGKKSKRVVVRFGPGKLERLSRGQYEGFMIRYEASDVVLVYNHGIRQPIRAVVDEDELTIDGWERKPQVFTRLTDAPVAFVPVALDVADRQRPKSKDVRKIRNELLRRESKDQAARNGNNERKIAKLDLENTEFLVETVSRFGWIDVERFDVAAANAAWLLTVHSGHVPLMLTALSGIEKDVRTEALPNGENYANLFDRLHLRLGSKQRFGTQIGTNEKGDLVVLPLADADRVDMWREEMKMNSLAESLERQRQWMGDREVTIDEFDTAAGN